jgi:signal transduction histidine kinase
MTVRGERPLTLACVADQSSAAAALNEALAALFPSASIVGIDTNVERVLPGGVDCAIVDTSVNGADGIDVMRGLRARGYSGALVLVVDPSKPLTASDEATLARSGARACALGDEGLVPLASAVADAIVVQSGADGVGATHAIKSLRQTQRLMAAGELAMRLQHSLNNPLAALLAEAQLLELETLAQDHRESVERIIELCRRVIDVVRGLDGVGRA